MKKYFLSLTLAFACTSPLLAQNNMADMLVNMLKMQIKEFKEVLPADQPDMIANRAPAFIPPNGKYDGVAVVEKQLDTLQRQLEVNSGAAIHFNTDEGETTLEYFTIKSQWMSLPCWKDVYISPIPSTVKSAKEKEVMVSQEKINEYMENGYMEPEGSFGPAWGESETNVYLSSVPEDGDYPYTLKGELLVSYPAEYLAFTFSAADSGKTVKMDKYEVTFLSMNKNTVMYRVKGPRGFSDVFQKWCTNKDGIPFNGRSGSSTDYGFYETARKKNFEMSDEEIRALAVPMQENAISGNQFDQLHIEKVQGTFHKITFYKVVNSGEKKLPFELKVN